MGETGENTRPENFPEDRISSLPDEVLVSILSLLMFKEAGRTSVLSKRWMHLWMSTINLNFDATEVLEELSMLDLTDKEREIFHKGDGHKYVRWVNKVLNLHKSVVLDEFRICFELDNSYQKQIDQWLEYAFARKVQRLELNLLNANGFSGGYENTYTFPQGLVGLRSGKSSEIHPFLPFDFKSLRALTFRSVNVTEEVLQFFLHNCPFLERLVVDGSHDLVNFEVCGPSLALKYLELHYLTSLKSVKVCNTTNLVSLKMAQAESLVLKDVPMLVDVNIAEWSRNFLRDVAVSWLSSCLSKLEILTLFDLSSSVQESEEFLKLPQLTSLKQLTLRVYAKRDRSLIGYTSLIRASPNLEKFVLKLQWGFYMERSERKLKKATSCPHPLLKMVQISGYYGRKSDLELINYFLKNAIALENIIVDPREDLAYRFRRCIEKIEQEEIARSLAKEQLKGKIPSHIKLVIL